MTKVCESCKANDVQILEPSSEPGYFFGLCNFCYARLTNKALRPLEFFNLAAIHSIDHYYLHDDFYNGAGEAMQPLTEVINSSQFPFPTLASIKGDHIKAVDLACVQFALDDKLISLLRCFEKQDILNYLDFKVSYNRSINYFAYRIAARVLGNYAGQWMRSQWATHKTGELFIFAEAVRACLSFDEAFHTIATALHEGNDSELGKNVTVLCYFESTATLAWLETVKHRITNVGTNWGVVAAASKLDWRTAKKWLQEGRPLSLVALDALKYCTTKGDRQNQSSWLIDHPPTLQDPPNLKEIKKSLTEYLGMDSVPRTRDAVNTIMKNLSSI
ncbi:MAG: hypothetical protein V4649_13525 [Bacteroidota bacterium]